MWEKILSGLYPRRCPVCGEIAEPVGKKVCDRCRVKLAYVTGPRCRKCSKQLSNERIEYCYDCMKKKFVYEKGLALFQHKEPVKSGIYAVKYQNRREYLDFYAEEMALRYEREIKSWQADVLAPVPLYKKKEIKRGFNQAEQLAKRIGKKINIPVEKNLLFRICNTTPQKELSDRERKKNVEKAFKVGENVVKSKRVILVDDIYTTGSTIDACAKILIQSGVEKVYFLAISIGDGL